jgi:hypothetical protein
VDERTPKPPSADDPTFLAPLPGEPHRQLTPEAAAALAAAAAALAAFDGPAEPGTVASARAAGPPPLDVFPPAQRATRGSVSHPASIDPVSPVAANPDSFWRGRLLMVLLMIALVMAGAAGAGWIFREPLARALTRWHVL